MSRFLFWSEYKLKSEKIWGDFREEEKEMTKLKRGINKRKAHNRILKLAKGYRGARSKQYRVAKQSVMRALSASYVGRKQKKRQFRQLWIARINAAARLNGLSYSKFMHGLKMAEIEINRKMLADMAINDVKGFSELVKKAKIAINDDIIIEFPEWVGEGREKDNSQNVV